MRRQLRFLFILFVNISIGKLGANTVIERPNIVLILADDLGYGDLSCYGATKIHTPHIDRLAHEGMRFTNAYAASAVCSPSRYALMTGRYDWRTAEQTGVLHWDAPLHIEPGRLTLASLLKMHGYRTGYFGKWHLGLGMNYKPVDWSEPLIPGPLEVGFDEFYGLPANHENVPEIYVEDHTVVDRIPGMRVWLEEDPKNPRNPTTRGVSPLRDKYECGPRVAEKAVDFIRNSPDGEPFFLYYSSVEPHIPITPTKAFQGSSECGPYGDFIQQLDHHVGNILAALEERGVMDNTLIIFTSDNGGLRVPEHVQSPHGEALRRGHYINGELRGRKHVIYEGGVRVPLIASWEGKIAAGSESAQVVSGVDIIATVGEIVGHQYHFGRREYIEDSFSLASVLFGKQPEREPVRPPVVATSCIGTFMVRDGDFKVIEDRELIPQHMQVVKFQYENWGHENSRQVYNLAKDIAEEQNLHLELKQIYQRLTKYLNVLRRDGSSHGFDPINY